MFTLLILSIMIFVPIPVMIGHMVTQKNPYKGVFQGILFSLFGIMLVFLMVKMQTGKGISEMVGNAFYEAIKVQDPAHFFAMFGIDNLSKKELADATENMVKILEMMVPGCIIVWTSILAYLNYMILSKIMKKAGAKVAILPPMRELSLPRTALIGAAVIYLLSYASGKMEIIDETMIMMNVQILLDFAFSVQGLAVAFYYADMKHVPKAVTVIGCLLLLFFNVGRMLFFMIGITEVVFGIRKRFPQKQA